MSGSGVSWPVFFRIVAKSAVGIPIGGSARSRSKFRREAQSLLYRIADARAAQLLELLRDIFCPELNPAPRVRSGNIPMANPDRS